MFHLIVISFINRREGYKFGAVKKKTIQTETEQTHKAISTRNRSNQACIISLLNEKIVDLFILKEFSDKKVNDSQNDVLLSKYRKHCGKEKMLVASIFSFSYNVFKSPLYRSIEAGIVWQSTTHAITLYQTKNFQTGPN